MSDTLLPTRSTSPAPVRPRRPRRGLRATNRLLLALTALLLLALGWYALTAAYAYGGPPRTLPDWWPGAHESGALPGSSWWHELRSHGDDSLWRALGYVLPALLLLAALAWLAWQWGPRARRMVGVPGTDARLRGAALASVVAGDTRELAGVRRARASVHGRADRPWVRLRVTLDADAQPALVLHQLEQAVLARARTASGLDGLRVTARLRVVSHRPNRVAESAVQRVVS